MLLLTSVSMANLMLKNNVKSVFTSFKISNYFSVKEGTPYFLKSFLVYKFIFAKCKSCYIGETCRHLKTRIDEHIKKDKKFNVFQHLHSREECFSSFELTLKRLGCGGNLGLL